MHIYNWYHSNVTDIHYVHGLWITIYMAQSPCFLFPFAEPLFAPLSDPLYLETLLAVTGSVHLGLRLLVN
jgi:hypothetical protein